MTKQGNKPKLPVLYSFRRCPYAIRARMGLHLAQVQCELREIVFRNKPQHMLEISPKGTVPVLWFPQTGQVIEESLEILTWALEQSDILELLPRSPEERSITQELVSTNDGPFKEALDRYKYPNRYPNEGIDPLQQRSIALSILKDWEDKISQGGHLLGSRRSLADIALFPFVRQFSGVDPDWFATAPLPSLRTWLSDILNSEDFAAVMKKWPLWVEDSPGSASLSTVASFSTR